MSQNPTAGMITTAQAATLLMVSDQWIRDLSKKGYIPKPENGVVPLVATVQGYIRWLKDEERRTSKTAAASRVQDARAQEIELRLAREKKDLIHFDDSFAAIDLVFGLLRPELSGVPARVTRDLQLRRDIESEIDGALERACDRLEQARANIAAGRDPFTPDSES